MDYPLLSLPDLAQADLPQFGAPYTEHHNPPVQQAYGPYDFGGNFAFTPEAQLPGDPFAIAQNHALHPFSQSSVLPSYVQHDATSAAISESVTAAPVGPTSPMGPPARPRKRKAATLRAGDWEPYKERILDLHIAQNLPLPKVKQMIEEEYDFTAEKDKNVKPHEMQAIVRKRLKRKLVETKKGPLAFEVRGSQVEQQKIERWMKRHKVVESALYAPSPAASTPSDVGCHTISERGSPAMISMYSPAASVLSPGGMYFTVQSPQMPSPALSISSIVRPQASAFAGQSPAPAYRSLPSLQPSFVYDPYTFGKETSLSAQPRYRQDEEERLWEQLRRAETSFVSSPSERSRVLYELGKVLIQQGRYKTAETVARKLVEGLKGQGSNDDDVETLNALSLLGDVLYFQGSYIQAEKLDRRVLKGRKKVLEPKDPDILLSMDALANLLFAQEQYKEAEEMHRDTLAQRRDVLGPEHRDTLMSMFGLAAALRDQGRHEESEAMHTETLALRRNVLGPEHPDTLISMSQLGSVLGLLGKYKEAEAMLEDALAMSKKVLGPEHYDTLIVMNHRGLVLSDQGKYEEAEAMHKKVLAISQRVLGPEHPETLLTVEYLESAVLMQSR
ncbi:hypothetical protein SLS59_009447 [Nothophoma quercina]|uniref:Clr5 domain-containing protein n=1 Tax=Nothophoma quercina TaxID=749835 RepID=A0ABR3QMA4_9PLEO